MAYTYKHSTCFNKCSGWCTKADISTFFWTKSKPFKKWEKPKGLFKYFLLFYTLYFQLYKSFYKLFIRFLPWFQKNWSETIRFLENKRGWRVVKDCWLFKESRDFISRLSADFWIAYSFQIQTKAIDYSRRSVTREMENQ